MLVGLCVGRSSRIRHSREDALGYICHSANEQMPREGRGRVGERKRREGIERRMIQRQRQCELISGDGGVAVVLAGVGRRRVGVGLRVRPVASVAVRELVVNLKASSNLSPNLSLSPSLSLSRPSLSPSWTSIRASHRPANHDMAFRRKISSTRICVL